MRPSDGVEATTASLPRTLSVVALPAWGLVLVAATGSAGAALGGGAWSHAPVLTPLRSAPAWLLVAGFVAVAAGGVSVRVPPLLAVLALSIAAGLACMAHATRTVASIDAPVQRVVHGVGQAVSDPEERFGKTSLIVDLSDRRYRVTTDNSTARSIEVGDAIALDGRPKAAGVTPMDRRAHVAATMTSNEVRRTASAVGIWGIGNKIRAQIRAGFGPSDSDTKAVLASLIIGDDRQLDPVTRDFFRRAGLSHVLVVSGQNLALLLAGFKPLLARLGPRLRVAGTLLLVAGFVVVVRPEPSVLRASAMAAIAMYASWTGRPGQGVRVVALAVCGCMLIDPLLVTSVGFWMSVAASTGIVCWSRRVASALERAMWIPTWLAELVGVTVSAQAAVAPLALVVGGPMPLASLWTNVAAEPVVFAVTIGGPLAALLVWIVPVASTPLAAPLWLGAHALTRVAEFASRHPIGAVDWREAMLLACGAVVFRLARVRPTRWVIGGATALLICAAHHPVPSLVRLPAGCLRQHRGRTILVIESVSVPDAVLSRWTKSSAPSADLAIVSASSTAAARLVGRLRSAARVDVVYAPMSSQIRSARAPPDGIDLTAATLLCRET